MIGVDRPHEGGDRGTASPLCSIGAGRTVLHILPGPALGRSARLCGNTPTLNGVEILPCADVANTKQDKPLLIRLAAETDGPRGARIPGGLESDCAL